MIHFDLPKEKSSIIKVIGVGGGGTERAGVSVPCAPCPVLVTGGGVALAAIFSFLAFCRQSGQVTFLAFAD